MSEHVCCLYMQLTCKWWMKRTRAAAPPRATPPWDHAQELQGILQGQSVKLVRMMRTVKEYLYNNDEVYTGSRPQTSINASRPASYTGSRPRSSHSAVGAASSSRVSSSRSTKSDEVVWSDESKFICWCNRSAKKCTVHALVPLFQLKWRMPIRLMKKRSWSKKRSHPRGAGTGSPLFWVGCGLLRTWMLILMTGRFLSGLLSENSSSTASSWRCSASVSC